MKRLPGKNPRQFKKRREQTAAWRKEYCWSPGQLRHTTATMVRKYSALEAAQRVLGNSSNRQPSDTMPSSTSPAPVRSLPSWDDAILTSVPSAIQELNSLGEPLLFKCLEKINYIHGWILQCRSLASDRAGHCLLIQIDLTADKLVWVLCFDVVFVQDSRWKFFQVECDDNICAGTEYYIVSLLVSELRKHGIRVAPQPRVDDGWDDGHAELSQLNADDRKSSDVIERQAILAKIGMQKPVQGPFVINAD